jgi:hypothetical protein
VFKVSTVVSGAEIVTRPRTFDDCWFRLLLDLLVFDSRVFMNSQNLFNPNKLYRKNLNHPKHPIIIIILIILVMPLTFIARLGRCHKFHSKTHLCN